VAQFNAEWNKTNEVPWINKLNDCKTISYVDISKQTDMAKKHKIAVIPTIIIFKDGEEVARFQADLSFKMVATREEVQEEIDNQLMSDF
jgi:thiol-disulfide isomerase/thioredoxin